MMSREKIRAAGIALSLVTALGGLATACKDKEVASPQPTTSAHMPTVESSSTTEDPAIRGIILTAKVLGQDGTPRTYVIQAGCMNSSNPSDPTVAHQNDLATVDGGNQKAAVLINSRACDDHIVSPDETQEVYDTFFNPRN